VDEQVVDYAVRIVRATREWPGLALGAGSRGALALVRGARAVALMQARNFVTPDDVKSIALPALRHRVALAPDASLEGRTPNDLLSAVIDSVAAPRA
jgi:MoxR-like ATPase